MTCGIYLLKFTGTNRVYIGQSKNIEYRYTNHIWKCSRGEGAIKLQEAFERYGEPELLILKECSEDELSVHEIQLIKAYDSLDNGLNASKGGESGPFMEGLNNSNSIYKEEELFNVLYFLSEPLYSIEEIEKLTGVTKRAIQNIASLKSHRWLKDKWPTLYSKIEELKKHNRNSVHKAVTSDRQIISPEGIEYTVTNIKNFAKEHNLLDSSISSVLSGGRKTHKGWHLPGYKAPREFYPEIISPEGIMHIIKFNTAATFAKQHNLDPSALRHVLHGHAKSHKGWKLANKIIDLQKPID